MRSARLSALGLTVGVCAGLLALCPAPGWTQSYATEAAIQPEAASPRRDLAIGRFQRQAVVSAHALASQAGDRILRQGGNAIDAAVATQFALAVVEPQSSGLGGGGFAVVFDGHRVWALDGREAAPAGADARLFVENGQVMGFDAARRSPRSVGVPGLVPLLWAMHQRHGHLPWAALLAPAIALAEHGFALGPRLRELLHHDPLLRTDPYALALFYDANGQPQALGSVLRNPELAWILRRIAAQGPQAMNRGSVARALLRRIDAGLPGGSAMTRADLRQAAVRVSPALCFAWPALPAARLCGPPPPSSGTLAVGQILNLWQSLPQAATAQDWNEGQLHAYIESARLAYADRAAFVGDPTQVTAPGAGWHSLLLPSYLRPRARLVQDQRMPRADAGTPDAAPQSRGVMPDQAEYGTTHLNVVDARGLAVALSSSLESAFGARRMVNTGQGRAGGFLLNHQLTDFALNPIDAEGRPLANAAGPGKRPRSSMTPMLVLSQRTQAGPYSEQVMLALGSAGGPFIIHHVAQTLIRWAQAPDRPEELAQMPRWGLTDPQGPIWLEAGTAAVDWSAALQARGHPTRVADMSSGLHAVWRDAAGHWITLADPRREGAGAGH